MSNEVCDEITYPLPNVNLHRLVIDTLFRPRKRSRYRWNIYTGTSHIRNLIARFMGPHGAYLGPTWHRWAPSGPREPFYLGMQLGMMISHPQSNLTTKFAISILHSTSSNLIS